jgi:uncharacterized protein (TIGR03790 family)
MNIKKNGKCHWIAMMGLFSLCHAMGGAARHNPGEVLLVVNTNSPISETIAGCYMKKRHIKNIVYIQCPDSSLNSKQETIPLKLYTQLIENPISEYLRSHSKINFIVLTKGIPIRISDAPLGSCDEHSRDPVDSRGHPSVDSSLASLGYAVLPGAMKINIAGSGAVGIAYSNRYWNASEPFSHAKFGGYLVTRLDGYTSADAEALIVRAIESEKHLSKGEVLLDVQPLFGLGDKSNQPAPITGTVILRESPWSEYNADLRHAHDLMESRGIANELDLRPEFVGNRTNLLAYFSWGSNDARYSASAYQSLSFAPGSISDTAVSTCARTFLPTRGGQSLLVDLISHGLTCGKGYVDEPLLQANASPTIAMDRYTSGYTMAESFYAASHFVGWEDVVVGDPLCCPYPRTTSVNLSK